MWCLIVSIPDRCPLSYFAPLQLKTKWQKCIRMGIIIFIFYSFGEVYRRINGRKFSFDGDARRIQLYPKSTKGLHAGCFTIFCLTDVLLL